MPSIFIDANCNSNSLTSSINDMSSDIATVEGYLNDIHLAKNNTRKYIDCQHNEGQKEEFFTHYEGLCRRAHQIQNVYDSLKYKKQIFEAERDRCNNRSKLITTACPT